MIYCFNKFVGWLCSPFTLGAVMVLLGGGLIYFSRFRRQGGALFLFAVIWLYGWSIGVTERMLGLSLEDHWMIERAENMPTADMIVLLGGGVSSPQNETYPYADLKQGADRAWYAAKLWKAGKAASIIVSNRGAEKCDNELLMDLGVPKGKIILENRATTTEENAKFVSNICTGKVLLVTSAYHMRRSILMFKKYAQGIDIIPAPCDFETTAGLKPIGFEDFIPSVTTMANNYTFYKEHLGYWGYRLLR